MSPILAAVIGFVIGVVGGLVLSNNKKAVAKDISTGVSNVASKV